MGAVENVRMEKIRTSRGAPRAATGRYPFRDHRSVTEIDTGRQGLTPRAAELLAYLRERETTPSYREMARALGLNSMAVIHELVHQLEGRGAVTVQRGAGGHVLPFSVRVVTKRASLGSVATDDLLDELQRRGIRWTRAA